HLSPSRLRSLFKQEVGFTIQQYARWLAVWRASLAWRQGRSLTDVAMEAGFYDLPHIDHAFNEVFGINPTNVIDPHFVRLVN
ncbi:helix-turn-helix domain-containing protein, partial [Acinetobacter baumannii]